MSEFQILRCYEELFYETQTLKMNCLKSSVAQIKEEIIEINPELGMITGYMVIVE